MRLTNLFAGHLQQCRKSQCLHSVSEHLPTWFYKALLWRWLFLLGTLRKRYLFHLACVYGDNCFGVSTRSSHYQERWPRNCQELPRCNPYFHNLYNIEHSALNLKLRSFSGRIKMVFGEINPQHYNFLRSIE